jgi:hypothetical protein
MKYSERGRKNENYDNNYDNETHKQFNNHDKITPSSFLSFSSSTSLPTSSSPSLSALTTDYQMQGGAVSISSSGYDLKGNISFSYCLFEGCYSTPVYEKGHNVPVERRNEEGRKEEEKRKEEEEELKEGNEREEGKGVRKEEKKEKNLEFGLERGGAVFLQKVTYFYFSSCR